jgi:hypothetical protein
MAINEAVNVKVDVQGTENVKKTGQEFDNLRKVTEQTREGLNSATKSTTLMGEATGKLREKLNQASTNFAKLKGDLSAIPGPVGAVVQGFTGLNTAFKAIIANPIGLLITAIVLALTGLFKILTSTKAGAEQFQQVLDGLGAAIDVVRDRLLKVGSAIVKFFSGDFKGAFSEAKGAVSGLTDEIAREAKEAANLRKELQGIADDERALNIERAKQNTLVAESKLRINDENLSYGERLKALEQVRASEVKLAKQEEELAKRKYEAIKAQNALSDSSQEALDAEANAYIALQAAQRTSLTVQKELFDQEKALRDRQKAEIKAQQQEAARIAKEKKDAEQKRLDDAKAAEEKEFQDWLAIEVKKQEDADNNAKYAEQRRQKELEDEEEMFQAQLEYDIQLAEMKAANAEYVAKKKKEADEEEMKSAQAKADLEQEIFDNAQALAQALINIVGQNTKAGKALALASIAADTARALSGALSNANNPASPDNIATGGLAAIPKYIALATTILTNSKRAYDIIKAPAPSISPSGGGSSASAVPRFNAPSTRLPGGGDEFTQVRRVYVTERDITNVQDKVKVTESLSQF